jgi:hypothetical protein
LSVDNGEAETSSLKGLDIILGATQKGHSGTTPADELNFEGIVKTFQWIEITPPPASKSIRRGFSLRAWCNIFRFKLYISVLSLSARGLYSYAIRQFVSKAPHLKHLYFFLCSGGAMQSLLFPEYFVFISLSPGS